MQELGLSFTFKRDNFSPVQYFADTVNDNIDIIYMRGCFSIAAEIENLAREYNSCNENGKYIIRDIRFLEKLFFTLLDEKDINLNESKRSVNNVITIHDIEHYRSIIKSNLLDLEWLLFYLNGKIALSQMVEKLSPECFIGTGTYRDEWLAMCKAWGNYSPDNFEIIFWIS